MDFHVIQTNSVAEVVFWAMVWSYAIYKEELSAPRETSIKAGIAWWVSPSWWVVVCLSAEVGNCVAQMGALNTIGSLSDGYTVQAQSAND